MREIEVKAKLENPDEFLLNTEKLGIKFSKVMTQNDTTYETDIPYGDPNWNIFRIRKQDKKKILTMKHKASLRKRDNYEYESEIENEKDIEKILLRLGYKTGININKKRRTAKYGDVEICLDEVDRLGWFVEVEKLTDENADVDSIQDDLWALLTSLGVKPNSRIFKGYDTLMHELKATHPTD